VLAMDGTGGLDDLSRPCAAEAQWFYRIVVVTLGATIPCIVIAITVLLLNRVDSFDALTAIGSAAIGGIVGLLAPSPVGQR